MRTFGVFQRVINTMEEKNEQNALLFSPCILFKFRKAKESDRESRFIPKPADEIMQRWKLKANLEDSVGSLINSGHFKPVWETAART